MPPTNTQRAKLLMPLSSLKFVVIPIFDRLFATSPGSAGSQLVDNSTYIEVYNACYHYLCGTRSKVPPESSAPSTIITNKGVGLGGNNLAGNMGESRPLIEDESVDQPVKFLGYDFYHFLDEYFDQKAKEIASQLIIGDDKVQAVTRVFQQFNRYNNISRVIARMLQYLDRFYVARVHEEGSGWLQKRDLETEVPEKMGWTKSLAYKQKEHENLKKWGYNEGGEISGDDALASAQAASSSDRIIPVYPLAMRNFRMEVVEPLFLNSDDMVKWIKETLMPASQERLNGELNAMNTEFQVMLRRVGVFEQVIFS